VVVLVGVGVGFVVIGEIGEVGEVEVGGVEVIGAVPVSKILSDITPPKGSAVSAVFAGTTWEKSLSLCQLL
jgi:hypothetical protein